MIDRGLQLVAINLSPLYARDHHYNHVIALLYRSIEIFKYDLVLAFKFWDTVAIRVRISAVIYNVHVSLLILSIISP